MLGAKRLAFALLAALHFGIQARTARAEAPNPHATPVYVLSLSTDDVDDQADALTLALQSLVREAQGWSLLESPQGFQTLALALKCPPKPDTVCLQRIADQLHADHYVWGRAAHKKGVPEISAELHLWSRSTGDAEVTTSFSDNLKDANDPSLRKVASRAFGMLTGSGASGTLIVHAGSGSGSVLVDGMVKGNLRSGLARVGVGEGAHKIAVHVSGFDAKEQDATVAAGAEQDVSFSLEPASPTFHEAPDSTAQSFPVRKVLGYSAIVIGGGLLVGAGIGTYLWIKDSDQSNTDRQKIPSSVPNVCADESSTWASYARDACALSKDAEKVSIAAWALGISGAVMAGVGIVLVATDHHSSGDGHEASVTHAPGFEVLPVVGPKGGSMTVRVTF
jgi:hypothetical protein